MQHTTIQSKADGLVLDINYCEAENPIAVVQLCHGMCEHKERYIQFMEFLAENGITSWINDKRGHGKSVKSPDDLGYFYSDDKHACVEDIKTINELLHEKYPELPIFLLGHSMGSLEVRVYTKTYDSTIDGLIVCGCPSPLSNRTTGDFIIKRMTALFGPRHRSDMVNRLVLGVYNKPYSKESDSFNNWISADRDNVVEYDNDELCGFTFTLNGFEVLMEMVLEAYTHKGWNCTNPQLPILFLSGEDDPCRVGDEAFQEAINYMSQAGYSNIDFKTYPGLRHEILNEKSAPYVKEDVLNFLLKCLG